jgi:dUTP pyrophosphatase
MLFSFYLMKIVIIDENNDEACMVTTPRKRKRDNSSLEDKKEERRVLVKRCSDSVRIPKRHKKGDAGFDISSAEEIIIKPGAVSMVSTGLSLCIPEGYYGQIISRSGQALRGLIVHAGVIDRNFTGEIKIIAQNISGEEIKIEVGERVAQIVFIRIWEGDLVEVNELSPTDRNDAGFGSSGIQENTDLEDDGKPVDEAQPID